MTLLLITFYLCIPVMGFAHVNVPDVGKTDILSIAGVTGTPCEHCPCSDEQGSNCCDTACCSCAFHSPPVQIVQVRYAPVEIITRRAESFRKLPQVYLSIFVPPQNRPPEHYTDDSGINQRRDAVASCVTELRHNIGSTEKVRERNILC